MLVAIGVGEVEEEDSKTRKTDPNPLDTTNMGNTPASHCNTAAAAPNTCADSSRLSGSKADGRRDSGRGVWKNARPRAWGLVRAP